MDEQTAPEEVILRGIPASPGVVHGRVFLLIQSDLDIPAYMLEPGDRPGEIERFEQTLIETRQQITMVRAEIAESLGEAEAQIFDAHQLVLEDRALINEVVNDIREQGYNAEHCFNNVARRYIEFFDSMEDAYLKERVADIRDVAKRVLRNLLGRSGGVLKIPDDRILITEELTPSDTAQISNSRVLALATDSGGQTSHAVIMARSIRVPAVVGLHDATDHLKTGDEVIVDGYEGLIIGNPSEATLYRYGRIRRERESIQELFLAETEQPPITLDNTFVALHANVEGRQDLPNLGRFGAGGVGLFRTEGIFLKGDRFPSEEEQYEEYRAVVEGLANQPITIRTLDIGGDKTLDDEILIEEDNPFMGFRAIRFCLHYKEVFKEQLRAILRASAHGEVKLMYPMISGVEELLAANEVLEEAKEELRERDIPFNESLPVGTMIEIPSAAMSADLLAQHCAFFSIGTNDLIQYLFAADRLNDRIAHLYQPSHPAVVRTLRLVFQGAEQAGIPVSVCGELGSDPLYTALLIGLGASELSLTASTIPEVRYLLRRIRFTDACALADQCCQAIDSAEILSKLTDFYDRHIGDLADRARRLAEDSDDETITGRLG